MEKILWKGLDYESSKDRDEGNRFNDYADGYIPRYGYPVRYPRKYSYPRSYPRSYSLRGE